MFLGFRTSRGKNGTPYRITLVSVRLVIWTYVLRIESRTTRPTRPSLTSHNTKERKKPSEKCVQIFDITKQLGWMQNNARTLACNKLKKKKRKKTWFPNLRNSVRARYINKLNKQISFRPCFARCKVEIGSNRKCTILYLHPFVFIMLWNFVRLLRLGILDT